MLLAEMKMVKKDREVEERETGDIEEETLEEKVVRTSEEMIQITEVDREDRDSRDLQPLSQTKMVTLISKLLEKKREEEVVEVEEEDTTEEIEVTAVAEEAEATEVIEEETEDLAEESLQVKMKLAPLNPINSQLNQTKLPNDILTKSFSRFNLMQWISH